MNVQDFIDHHPGWFAPIFPIYFVSLWLIVATVISLLGGWYALAKSFRATHPFSGPSWGWQSGRMRLLANYNHCLRLGASAGGLYLATLFLFRFMHPPLLLPWSEIKVRRTKSWLFGEYVTFTLGHEQAIPLRIRGRVADKLRPAAGVDWPIEEM
jgi:hypothetical protein